MNYTINLSQSAVNEAFIDCIQMSFESEPGTVIKDRHLANAKGISPELFEKWEAAGRPWKCSGL
jgi:hypothetical protein